MAHYATLREYHFRGEDINDIHGATVYGPGQQKEGKVDDVVLDHATGEVHYLVINTGRGHKRLVPADNIFRAVVDEEDFEITLSREQLESLPEFDPRSLANEVDWKEYEKRYREAFRKYEREELRAYKERGWHEEPVQHRRGSTHNITPDPDEIAAPGGTGAGASAPPAIPPEDLTPRRLAGKFPDPAPRPSKMVESVAPPDPHAHTTLLLSARWERFREDVRSNAENIREGCIACSGNGEQEVA